MTSPTSSISIFCAALLLPDGALHVVAEIDRRLEVWGIDGLDHVNLLLGQAGKAAVVFEGRGDAGSLGFRHDFIEP